MENSYLDYTPKPPLGVFWEVIEIGENSSGIFVFGEDDGSGKAKLLGQLTATSNNPSEQLTYLQKVSSLREVCSMRAELLKLQAKSRQQEFALKAAVNFIALASVWVGAEAEKQLEMLVGALAELEVDASMLLSASDQALLNQHLK